MDYHIIVQHYSRRVFSNQEDALFAMAGISRRLAVLMKCTFFQGMPRAWFDASFLFHSYQLALRRRKIFPSYSWVGWTGGVQYNLPDGGTLVGDLEDKHIWITCQWLRFSTWIEWYQRSSQGAIEPLWRVEDLASQHSDHGYRYRDAYPHPWRHYHDSSTFLGRPSEQLRVGKPLPSYPVLQFWTLAVYLKLQNINVLTGIADITHAGFGCGMLWMDSFEEDEFFDDTRTYEFILLSDAPDHPFCLGSQALWKPGLREKMYHVLVLEYDRGVAERRGLGVISELAIKKSAPPGPLWKEIILA
jgi:hypothetical protein